MDVEQNVMASKVVLRAAEIVEQGWRVRRVAVLRRRCFSAHVMPADRQGGSREASAATIGAMERSIVLAWQRRGHDVEGARRAGVYPARAAVGGGRGRETVPAQHTRAAAFADYV
jgi:hypothetical protein